MSNRRSRFTQSLIAGYGAISVNIVTNLLSVPLALAYLSKEEFGLWALAYQVNGYLGIIDMGMSGAIARFLADHKDKIQGRAYSEHFATGVCVFFVQSVIVTSLGIILSNYAPSLLSIRPELSHEFTFLLRALCMISGFSIICRAFGSPLWAFQRMDVVNLSGLIALIVQFLVMWIGFHLGCGLRSFAFAAAVTTLVAPIAYIMACTRCSYYPSCPGWFRPKWSVFREMFAYGRDGMMLSIGSQLVNATQITIISRILGLNVAASFSIATKLYSLSLMLFHKIVESAAPGLAEMFIRGQLESFVRRYWDMVVITLAMASVGAVALASVNSAFITLWTGGKITWSPGADFLLGLMVLATSASRCFIGLFNLTKSLKSVRLIYLVEGMLFVPVAIQAARWYGVHGVVAASLLVHLAAALIPSLRAASKVLGSCSRLAKPLALTVCMTGVGTLLAFSVMNQPLALRLPIAMALVILTVGMVWRLIITVEVRSQVLLRFKNDHRAKILWKISKVFR